jgi:electron transfer flavoprotein alpha subunit
MTSLVIAEHDNASLKDATHKAVTAAAQVSAPVHVLVAGENCAAVAEAAAKIAGVEKVLLADAALYAKQLAEPMETLILSVAQPYDAILAPATTSGKNILPRVAAKLDIQQVSEITKVISPDTFERPIYAGNAIETVQAPAGQKIITVRTTGFDAVAAEGGKASIENIAAGADAGMSAFVGRSVTKSERPELTAAKRSGRRLSASASGAPPRKAANTTSATSGARSQPLRRGPSAQR